MKFGIFYELQIPKPWEAHTEMKVHLDALDQVELADKLGYDYAWEVEHHFLEEYSHSPAPEVFLGAASQRTKRIRLGHGIIQLTTNHPARVAEKVATLDLLSRGRVEFGMGESASITELEPFGVTMDDKREVWEEAVKCVMPMFGEAPVEFAGKHFKMPYRNVLPKPIQKPHPPLWVACSQLETIEMAGRRGMGALGFQFVSADAAHAWVHAYYNAITKRLDKLCDYQINPNIAMVSYFMCAKTDEEARQWADGATFFQFALRYYGNNPGRARPRAGTSDVWKAYETWKAANPADAAARADRRPDRLARYHPQEAAAFPAKQRRPDHPAQSGRQDQSRAYLRVAGVVRQGSHAGVPGDGARASGMEAPCARSRHRVGGDRYRRLHEPLRRQVDPAQRRAGDGGRRGEDQVRGGRVSQIAS